MGAARGARGAAMRGSFMNCMGDRGAVTIAIAGAGGNVAGHKTWGSFALFSGLPSSPLCMKIKHEGLPSNPLCMKMKHCWATSCMIEHASGHVKGGVCWAVSWTGIKASLVA